MKKLFLSFAVIAGLSMISCGNKAENAAAEVEEAPVEEVVEAAAVEAVDTVTNDTVAAVAVEEVEAPAAE